MKLQFQQLTGQIWKSYCNNLQTCNNCNRDVTVTPECTICCKWLCQQCCSFTDEVFKFASTHANIQFICEHCLPQFDSVIKMKAKKRSGGTIPEPVTKPKPPEKENQPASVVNIADNKNNMKRIENRMDKLENIIDRLSLTITSQESKMTADRERTIFIERNDRQQASKPVNQFHNPWGNPSATIYDGNSSAFRFKEQEMRTTTIRPECNNDSPKLNTQEIIINTLDKLLNREREKHRDHGAFLFHVYLLPRHQMT